MTGNVLEKTVFKINLGVKLVSAILNSIYLGYCKTSYIVFKYKCISKKLLLIFSKIYLRLRNDAVLIAWLKILITKITSVHLLEKLSWGFDKKKVTKNECRNLTQCNYEKYYKNINHFDYFWVHLYKILSYFHCE